MVPIRYPTNNVQGQCGRHTRANLAYTGPTWPPSIQTSTGLETGYAGCMGGSPGREIYERSGLHFHSPGWLLQLLRLLRHDEQVRV